MGPHTFSKKLYHGWLIVVTCFALMAFAFTPIVSVAGVFTIPVSEELMVPRASFNLHMSIATLSFMFTTAFVGKLFQKCNVKKMMAIATVVLAACFFGYSIAAQIWQFYCFSVLAGVSAACVGTVTISMLINSWFGPKLRGKALGIAQAGSGVSAIILNPLLSQMNNTVGWRFSYRMLAGLLILVCLVLILATIHRSPQDKGLSRIGEAPQEHAAPKAAVAKIKLGQAVKSPRFFFIFLSFLLIGAVGTTFTANGQAYFVSVGFSQVSAGALMSIASVSVIFGKILLGSACDKWGPKRAACAFLLCSLLGGAAFAAAVSFPDLIKVGVVVYGLGNAVGTVAVPLIVLELFNDCEYGSILGVCNMGTSLGSSIGPMLGSLIYDQTGSYSYTWLGVIGMMAIALLTLSLAYRSRLRSRN